MITFYIFLITCVFAVIGYLLGSILFSVIISELANKDVRYLGSKNPGSTNIARILGIKIGFVNAILDAVKGYVAVIICLIIYRYSIAV
jgi:glycerol-3-phosphate acyltransferase PlsY